MIHVVEVDAEISPDELRKIFRKKLMTGGAVLRLRDGLGANDLEKIYARFVDEALENNLAGLVLAELARAAVLPTALRENLTACGLQIVRQALAERADASLDAESILQQKTRLVLQLAPEKLHDFFQAHLGSSAEAVAGRLALCNHPELPDDLALLLTRDSESRVRFRMR